MKLIKDKTYVYVDTTMTGSCFIKPGSEFKFLDDNFHHFNPSFSGADRVKPIDKDTFFVSSLVLQEKESVENMLSFFEFGTKYKMPKILFSTNYCHWCGTDKEYATYKNYDIEFEEYVFLNRENENKFNLSDIIDEARL